MKLALFFIGVLAWCQAPEAVHDVKVNIRVSHQPLEAFRAAFIGKVKGVGLYRVSACNLSQDYMTTVTGGLTHMVAEEQIAVIDQQLVQQVAEKGRRNNALYWTVTTLEYASLGASFFGASGVVAIAPKFQVIFPAVAGISHKLGGEYAARGIPTAAFEVVTDKTVWDLDPNQCRGGVIFGSYYKSLPPWSRDLMLRGYEFIPIQRPAMRR